ncbi:MAG: DNA alkylation repair protein [Planctomycetes bacterium]|nr:DNA alkylation repair protein [Planctomycetota bacterium]MBL7037490.1 DNA alkylation repair protein [Pirellulaceae bacterium]
MTHRRRRLLVIAALLAVVGYVGGWYAYTEYRKAQFLRDLDLVVFSTSLIGSPRGEEERAAHQRADELGIDLFAAYENNLETGSRFHLAWMLITNESPEYYQLAKQNIDFVPWPEARIWAVRRKQESLSPEYRKKLLDLVLASPTSEAKLAAARWYRKQGKITESEDAYQAAMTNGLFWDALDAADQLLESERYHDDAVYHLLSVVRDSRPFTGRAAFSLLKLYDVREELEPLVESCRKEPNDGPNRKSLVDKLTQLVEKDVGESRPKTHAP